MSIPLRNCLLSILVYAALGGCSLHEYTKDETHRAEAAGAVGHCFRTQLDVHVIFKERVETDDGGRVLLRSDGFIEPWPGKKELERVDAPIFPKGTRFTVERVLGQYYPQVGMFLKPYARVGDSNKLIDVTSLFWTTSSNEPLKPVDSFLADCD